MPNELVKFDDPGSLWVDGEFWLSVRDRGAERIVHVRRPYGLLGRLEGADVAIDDRSVSARHVYLHLDPRGLYAVDLSSRTGTRLPAAGQLAAWIDPGQEIEVAGRAVRLVDYRIHRDLSGTEPGCPRTDLLALGDPELVRLTLYPEPAREPPRSLDSELVFAGRGATCGIRIEGASASRVHLALVRTRTAAYAVDLLGRGTRLNDRPIPGAVPLIDGDCLTLGVARLRVRSGPSDYRETSDLPAVRQPRPRPLPAEVLPQGRESIDPATLAELVMRLIHAGQLESFRRQDEFQTSMVQLIHQMRMDNETMLSEHLQRIEKVNMELAALKEEIARRLGPAPRPSAQPPPVAPLKINTAASPAADPGAATDWLLNRVSQLEEESRSSWKDLLGRLSGGVR